MGNDPTTIGCEARLLEERGVDTIWFPDAPLIGYGDPFACMALAAAATDRIRLGTNITPAGTRPVGMLLTHFATINRIAPGRVRLGWGSGSFSRSLLGQPALKVRELRTELTALRALLTHQSAEINGQKIHFNTSGRRCLNLKDSQPLEIAAQGPRGAALAGEFGDGLMTAGEVHPERLRILLNAALEAAGSAGRPTEDFSFTAEVGPLCILRPGESVDSQRVIASVQPAVTGHFGFFLVARLHPDQVDPGVRGAYAKFLVWANECFGPDPDEQFRALCDNYIGRNPEHDQFVTAGAIKAHTLTAPLEAMAERLQEISRAGVTDVAVLYGLDQPWAENEALADLVTLMEHVG
ncbi:LLM class flavin-dependent oxidoreductase [Mycobacterium aquaticum]|uniref:LLM class flavin-dependent oxidoreductase n=1 Tax=Mycobacterium aquaticum TaxID=1927124 RepID=UPI001301AFD9|nr:LLM class flavin-dependent oxidoreductase [Mycobacterium aquaticum]